MSLVLTFTLQYTLSDTSRILSNYTYFDGNASEYGTSNLGP